MSPSLYWGTYCFCPVRLLVCLFVCTNFNIDHNFCNIEDINFIFGRHLYLMELHILSGERSRSRSSFKVKVKYMGQNDNFCNIEDTTNVAT